MKKIIFLLIITIINSFVYAKIPKVFVSLNPKEIKSGQKVEIILGAIAKKKAKMIFPKIDIIDGNKILNKKSTVSHSIEEINNKKVPLVKRTITYTIKPENDFEISSFIIKINSKEFKTTPFKVNLLKNKVILKEDIQEQNSSNSENNTSLIPQNNFIFKMTSDKKEIVVGESFIVKVELFEPIDLSESDLEYTPPIFKNFNAIPLGDGKTLEQGDNIIRTIQYLVTAKKSGIFTIKPAKAKVGIQVTPQAQSPFGFFGTDIQWKKLSTKALKIDVKEAPKDIDFVGKFKIDINLDSKFAKANKPFNYTVVIEGIGNLDNIKDPNIKINNITSYSNDSKIKHIVTKGKIYSKYKKKFIFISDKDFTIPSIEYKVYSPSLKKTYILKTQPYHVIVKKSKTITDALKESKPFKHKKSVNKLTLQNTTIGGNKSKEIIEHKKLDKVEDLLFDKYYYKRKYSQNGYPFNAILGALILGIILGAGGVVLVPSLLKIGKSSKNKNKLFNSYEEALNILYPHTTKSKNIENMVELLYEVTNGNTEIKIDDYALKRMIKKVTKNKK